MVDQPACIIRVSFAPFHTPAGRRNLLICSVFLACLLQFGTAPYWPGNSVAEAGAPSAGCSLRKGRRHAGGKAAGTKAIAGKAADDRLVAAVTPVPVALAKRLSGIAAEDAGDPTYPPYLPGRPGGATLVSCATAAAADCSHHVQLHAHWRCSLHNLLHYQRTLFAPESSRPLHTDACPCSCFSVLQLEEKTVPMVARQAAGQHYNVHNLYGYTEVRRPTRVA